MKFFYLCIFFCSLFISCSDNSDANFQNPIAQRIGLVNIDSIPINKANPYDAAGQVHLELLTAYYSGEGLPLTLNGIVSTTQTIANNTLSFSNLTGGVPYIFNNPNRVTYIVSQPVGILDEVIVGSIEGSDARTNLKSFINSLLDTCEQEEDFGVLYDYIVSYENSILQNGNLSHQDRQTIFITSSIARHSVYARKKKPKKNTDPDWSLLIGNIVAALDGADDGMADAVMKGLITGIVENTR